MTVAGGKIRDRAVKRVNGRVAETSEVQEESSTGPERHTEMRRRQMPVVDLENEDRALTEEHMVQQKENGLKSLKMEEERFKCEKEHVTREDARIAKVTDLDEGRFELDKKSSWKAWRLSWSMRNIVRPFRRGRG